jgi:hypothetical protein
MIELETMLMQFCLETSGRLSETGIRWVRVIGSPDRRIILWHRPAQPLAAVTVLHGVACRQSPWRAMVLRLQVRAPPGTALLHFEAALWRSINDVP